MTAWVKTLVLLTILFHIGRLDAGVKANPLLVTGWPLAPGEAAQAILSGDAIMGTLVCPSLTRLNLLTKDSETVLLEKLEQSDRKWRLTLRPNLIWWDQSAVTMQDLEDFVRLTLQDGTRTASHPAWTLPEFKINQTGRILTIQWAKQPIFGPYLFNQLAWTKKVKGGLGFMCAGAWKAIVNSAGISLENPLQHQRNAITLSSSMLAKRPAGSDLLAFRFGEELPAASPIRPLGEELICPRKIDTPIFTVIAWNPQGASTRNPRFRRAMTHLIPRGALLRAGAGHLGDLVSAPILRVHPGYKRSLLVPSYDPQKAEALLDELGYRRGQDDGYRRNSAGQPLEIKLLARDQIGSGLLRKVLDDGFRALGIKLQFIEDGQGVPDGLLTGIISSWPDSDLSRWLDSRSAEVSLPWHYQDPSLDHALEAYALALTHAAPNFALLEKVHDLVYQLEPFSVLMQHQVCLDAQWPDYALPVGELSLRNPDWFPKFIGL